MLSIPVQLIAWKDRPQNDLLCVERDVKHLLTHLLTRCRIQGLTSYKCGLLKSAVCL